MNTVFFVIVLVAFVVTGYRQIGWVPDGPDAMSPMEVLSASIVESAGGAVELAPFPIAAMAGTLRLSPPLLRRAGAEDGGPPTGKGTSRAWPRSCAASSASGSATCCGGLRSSS